ncbi:hypothetical protein NPIL_20821 [Nephila pilipes]|uniref:Uncharacterized protein n=1 Tax=Nephila pilipes TaxID=299642 RepID=A0A8X6TYC8_NEPPI|nr:hypothetical protein NPIL_20821 [Nephila pilipes]
MLESESYCCGCERLTLNLIYTARIEKEEFDLREPFVANAWGNASSEACVKAWGEEVVEGGGWNETYQKMPDSESLVINGDPSLPPDWLEGKCLSNMSV